MTMTFPKKTFGRSATFFTILLGAVLLGSTPSRADVCSASASAIVSRSTGGSCPAALVPNQVFTISYRVTNASIVDDITSPDDGLAVAGELRAGATLDAILAQTTALPASPELPGVLAFVPVCPVGSTGGTKAAGDECDPLLAECGTGVCGCVSALPGITCTDGVAANRLTLNVTQVVSMAPSQTRTLATVRVRRLTGSAPPVNCGEFFTHVHSVEDLLVVTDPICESAVTAGAEAVSDLHAPECFADTDCGDAECNDCADLGTDNHCEAANLGGACGTDGNASDCMTPACVDNGAGEGVCLQNQNDLAAGTGCDNNGGAPVSAVECQLPECDAGGTCANAPDPTQDGNACGTDGNLQDCLTPACLTGACAQEQNPIGAGVSCTNNGGISVPAVECRVPLCDAGGVCANEVDPSQDGDACGTDADLQDCLTPACLTGACAQEQNPIGAGASCTSNGGAPVPAVDCQVPLCGAGGVCANVPDPAQEGDPCADLDADNCYRARCAAGGCNQLAVCDPTEAPAVCRVTISDTIWADDDSDGIQDVSEDGIPGVNVAVYACSGGSPTLLQGNDTTDASGLYSFSMPTCNPSETLAINVSGSFAGALAAYVESPAFCDAGNPGTCGAEVTPAQDSNCLSGVSDCRSILLGTEDPTVDCGFNLCGNGVVNPGEECDEPTDEICNNSMDDNGNTMVDCDDPECMVPGYRSCDLNCRWVPPCVPILRDPATISWDRFKMHGYFVPTTSADLATGGFRILITNEEGEVYRGELLAGDLKPSGNSQSLKRWAFRDGGARSGEGVRSGISRVRVKQRREANGDLAYPFRIEVYGDMSRATMARMTIHLYADDDVAFLSATWQGEPGRWYLTQKQAEAGLVTP